MLAVSAPFPSSFRLCVLLPSLAFTTLALRLTLKIIRRRRHVLRTARELGCQRPPAVATPFYDPLGITLFVSFIREMNAKTALMSTLTRFRDLSAREKRPVTTFGAKFLGSEVIITISPLNVQAILATKFEDYGVEKLREGFAGFVGHGIFTSDGEAWSHSRSMLRPLFTRSQLDEYLHVFAMHITALEDQLPLSGAGQTIDLQPLFFKLTVDVSTHVLFGKSTELLSLPLLNDSTSTRSKEVDEHEGARFAAAFDRCTGHFGEASSIEIFGIGLPNRQYKRDCRTVRDFVDKRIQAALDARSSNEAKPPADSEALLSHLLSHPSNPSIETVRSECLNLLLAGRDTTASMLSDLFFELARHAASWAKLRAEILQHCASDAQGDDDGPTLTFETLKSLPYLRAVLNEGLRLHPVVPEDARIAMRDTVLPEGGGPEGKDPVFVPRHTVTEWSAFAMQRWAGHGWRGREEEFWPERWVDGSESGDGDGQGSARKRGIRPGWSYVPFNGGPRVCIGQQFALSLVGYSVVRVVLAMERAGVRLESRDAQPWRERFGITVTGFGGCRVGFVRE